MVIGSPTETCNYTKLGSMVVVPALLATRGGVTEPAEEPLV
jgi:hypothetical protein